jgi:hypothetical protein
MKNFTQAQQEIADQFVAVYDIFADQIAFDGDSTEPILDYEALCRVADVLTDFKSIDTSEITFDANTETAKCVGGVRIASGKHIVLAEFASIGECLPNTSTITSVDDARRLARSRALRSLIRAAGVNILKAHKQLLTTGEVVASEPIDPRAKQYKEIGVLKRELGLEVNGDDSEFRRFLGDTCDGKKSAKELDDVEIRRFIHTMRAMRRTRENLVRNVA